MDRSENSPADKPLTDRVQTIIIRAWREDDAFEDPHWRYLCALVHGEPSTTFYDDRAQMLSALERLLSSMTGEKIP